MSGLRSDGTRPAHGSPFTDHESYGLPTLSWVLREAGELLEHAQGPFTVLVDDYGVQGGPLRAMTVSERLELGKDRFGYVAACEPNRDGRLIPLYIFPLCPDDLAELLRGAR